MAQTSEGWVVVGAAWAIAFAAMGLVILQFRRWNRKARIKRRMLVNEDGLLVWRTVRGRCLVGWSNTKGEISSGVWGKPVEPKPGGWGEDWAVIQAAKDKLVVYRFDKRVDDEPRTGVIQVYNSWREFECAVPPNIFQEALKEAGIKKPPQYREVPLAL